MGRHSVGDLSRTTVSFTKESIPHASSAFLLLWTRCPYAFCGCLSDPRGLGQKSVMTCLITPAPNGQRRKERRTFSTMTTYLLRLRDWLKELQCSQVAMESTGVFWRPIFNILEGHVQLMVVNAQHIKAVPARKTDSKDAEWMADLLQHGLFRPSFISPA